MAKKQRKDHRKSKSKSSDAVSTELEEVDAPDLEESDGTEGQKDDKPEPESEKTDTTVAIKADAPKGGRTDAPEGVRSDLPKGKKTVVAKGEKTDVPDSKKTDSPKGKKTDTPKGKKADGQKDEKAKKKRIKRVLLTILGAAALVTATVFIVLYIIGDSEPIMPERPARPTGMRGTVVTEENLDTVREEIARPLEDASYNAVMTNEWTFQRWDRPSRNAYVENSRRNTRTVFFDVFLDSTNELIYESPYLYVGDHINNIALDTEVPAGEYTATLIYYLVDDEFEVITYVPVMIWLNILG